MGTAKTPRNARIQPRGVTHWHDVKKSLDEHQEFEDFLSFQNNFLQELSAQLGIPAEILQDMKLSSFSNRHGY